MSHEEKEVLETLRKIDERLKIVIYLLEEFLDHRRRSTYFAPTGFEFKSG